MDTEANSCGLTTTNLTAVEIDRPPKYLYKYRQPNELLRQILVENSLFYASPKDFKDKLDCRIPTELSGQADDKRPYIDGLIDQAWPSMSLAEKKFRLDRFFSEDRWKNTASEVQSIVDNCGVLCLSEQCDSRSMWEEYTQNHAGVCLEFLAADEKGLTAFGANSFKVTYSDEPEFNLLAEPWEQASQILFTKSMKLSYEKEWRILLPAPNGVSTVGNWLFPPEFLTSVIFGYKADNATKDQVKTWLAEGKCRPALYQVEVIGARLTKKRLE